jgi:hypothetical protein
VVGEDGKRASYDACIILCRYVLMCPTVVLAGEELVTFRNLNPSLTPGYFYLTKTLRYLA